MVRKKKKRSFTRRQHRAIGVSAALFLVFMVISGIALNHSQQLGLDQQPVRQSGLLDWYGLKAPAEFRDYAVNKHWLSFAGSHWYLDGKPAAAGEDAIGAVASEDWLLAAGSRELLIIAESGKLVESMRWNRPDTGPLVAIGQRPSGEILVRSESQTWQAETKLLDWTLVRDPGDINWSQPGKAPEALHQAINREHRGSELNMERVLIDLHSGRFFGNFGILVYDLLALALGSLAVSGLVLWWRGRRNGAKKHHRKHP